MQQGKQWLALDTQFFAKPFPLHLQARFGTAGVCLFIAFLCACKRNSPQGEISFMSDAGALQDMRVGWPLVDDQGVEWTLDDFWAFTGRMKQTKKTARGHVKNVKSTHFGRWQETIQRDQAAERKRRSRAKNGRDAYRDTSRDNGVTHTVTDIDSDIDIPPTPTRRFASNGKVKPQPAGPVIPEWHPEPEPGNVIDAAVVSNLRANPSGKTS